MIVITPAYVYVPPANGKADDANCAMTADAVTLRPTSVRCVITSAAYLVSVDLRGGDDQLSLRLPTARMFTAPPPTSLTVDGGAGADAIAVDATAPAPLVKGGDGDDVLGARGESTGATGASRAGPTFDGGAGRDLVDYTVSAPVPLDGESPEGVSVNLEAGSASFVLNRAAGGPTRTRDDKLVAIERVAGTPDGDVLVGSKNADELIGNDGPDKLDGRDGDDSLSGGAGEDLLIGGIGRDTLDGGPSLDEFPPGSGGDTLLTRDGAQEKVTCVKDDIVVDDLTDQLFGAGACSSISSAARVHVRDTMLTRRALAVGPGGVVRARISCPPSKAESCSGTLKLRLGGGVLAQRRYSLRPGHATRARLALSPRSLARARGHSLTLEASEKDDAGRPRRVVSHVRLRR